jgi:RNA polymerase-associated protein LEO1
MEEETWNQMMQNLFGDQSEDEEEADDDDDDQRQESPQQQQQHQELDDDEEDDARSQAHVRSDGYHSVSPAKLPQHISLPPPPTA